MSAPELGTLTGPVNEGMPLAPRPMTDAALMDLGSMSDSDFESALKRATVATKRVKIILDNLLIEGAHYGNPKNSFKHPILFGAGAEKLETTFRLAVYAVPPERETVVVPPTIVDGVIADPGFVSVTVFRGISTMSGVPIGQSSANCNSRERRFRKQGSKVQWTYDDARETLNDCIAIAEKRAKVRLVRGALGLTEWLATEEEMEAAAAAEDEKSLISWTKDEKDAVYAAAQRKGLRHRAFTELVWNTLGRKDVGTGADVEALLAAIETWTPAAGTSASDDASQRS